MRIKEAAASLFLRQIAANSNVHINYLKFSAVNQPYNLNLFSSLILEGRGGCKHV